MRRLLLTTLSALFFPLVLLAQAGLSPAWLVRNRPGDGSNSEQEIYKPANVAVSGGFVTMTELDGGNNSAYSASGQYLGDAPSGSFVSCSNTGGNNYTCNGRYSSGSMILRNLNFQYGDVQVRAKMAQGWPAIWMLGSNCQGVDPVSPDNIAPCNWDNAGSSEIDIAEGNNVAGSPNKVQANLFISGQVAPSCPDLGVSDAATNYHIYELVWNASGMTWLVDGVSKCTSSVNASDHYYLIMNAAIGGSLGGNPTSYTYPNSMSVDFVKICTAACANGTTNAPATNGIFYDDFSPTVTDGFTFPNAHPRLYWTSTNLPIAQAWVTSTGYTAVTSNPRPLDNYDMAFACYVMNNASACSAAVTAATGDNEATCSTSIGCDNMRVYGESYNLIYDWGYNSWTPSQRSTYFGNWTTWNNNMHGSGWGNTTTPGPSSNYFCGAIRRDLSFGIATYGDNANAQSFIDFMSNTDWPALINFASASGTGSFGKKGLNLHSQEGGGEYGRYCQNYFAIENAAGALNGRDLWADQSTPAFISDVYQIVYNTSPVKTTSRGMWDLFTWGDDEQWVNANGCPFLSHNATGNSNATGGCGGESQYYGDFMQGATNEFSAQYVGQVARTWLSTVKPAIGPIFKSVDPGGSSQAFSTLPLDYFAAGPLYSYSRSDWTANGASLLFQGGLNYGSGHAHYDAGTFQVQRKGVNIIRETMDYSSQVAGFNSSGVVGSNTGLAHNTPVIGGASMVNAGCTDGNGVVNRVDHETTYFYIDVDISKTYTNNACDGSNPGRENTFATHVEREVIFYRDLPAMLIVDRLGTDTATRPTTFTTHCEASWASITTTTATCNDGTQTAVYYFLNPATISGVSVNESANGSGCANCQFRLEATNSNPGATTNYFITVVQLRDSGGSNLTPSITDNGSNWTVTLDANHSAVVNKGLTSSGGSVTINGTQTSLSSTVQTMTAAATGITWSSSGNPSANPPSCSPGSGTYPASQTVTCSNTSAGAVMCYTTNGSTPATNGASGCTTGTLYSSTITVSVTETLNIIAGGTGYADSSVTTYNYTIGAPVASFSPTSLSFGGIKVGLSSGQQSITLQNTGSLTMNISSIGLTGANAGDYSETTTCTASLAINATCAINVTFSPLAIGTRTASVSVVSNTATSPDTVPVTGTGFLPVTGVGTISGTGTIKVQP